MSAAITTPLSLSWAIPRFHPGDDVVLQQPGAAVPAGVGQDRAATASGRREREISSGGTGRPRATARLTDGNWIVPGLISGAVTMKMISSTSITSMNGTMLIWLIGRGRGTCGRCGPRLGGPSRLRVQAWRCRMFENSSMKVSSAIARWASRDNTLIVWIWGDNGASMEGTITGSFNELTMQNGSR